jgi:hypothetical protein
VQTRASIAILVDPLNLIKDPTSGEDTAVTANVVFKSFVNASSHRKKWVPRVSAERRDSSTSGSSADSTPGVRCAGSSSLRVGCGSDAPKLNNTTKASSLSVDR